MATIADVELQADNFVLDATFEECPGMEVEIEQVVAHDREKVLPFLWVTFDASKDLETALEADPTTANVRLLSDVEGQRFYQMEWVDHIEFLVEVLVEEGGTIINAAGHEGQWTLRIVFPDRNALSRTHEYCEEQEIGLSVQRIYELENNAHGRYGLTQEQYDTLLNAFDQGFYDVPRGVSLEDLSDDLGISHQALSERLRRAHRELVQNTVVIGRDADTPPL